jgi:hypothetical protein
MGPPDEIEAHPSGWPHPFEKRSYRYVEGLGSDIHILFVDSAWSGEYPMDMDPAEKDALWKAPDQIMFFEQVGIRLAGCLIRTNGDRLIARPSSSAMTLSVSRTDPVVPPADRPSMLQRPPTSFGRIETLGIHIKAIEVNSGGPAGFVEFEIISKRGDVTIMRFIEDLSGFHSVDDRQISCPR